MTEQPSATGWASPFWRAFDCSADPMALHAMRKQGSPHWAIGSTLGILHAGADAMPARSSTTCT